MHLLDRNKLNKVARLALRHQLLWRENWSPSLSHWQKGKNLFSECFLQYVKAIILVSTCPLLSYMSVVLAAVLACRHWSLIFLQCSNPAQSWGLSIWIESDFKVIKPKFNLWKACITEVGFACRALGERSQRLLHSWSRSISILATLPVLRITYQSYSPRSPPSAVTLTKNYTL